jgi:hypothetical protein
MRPVSAPCDTYMTEQTRCSTASTEPTSSNSKDDARVTLHVIAALVERRREIMRELAYLQQEARSCEESISHIDATIRLLDPQFDLSQLAPKKSVIEDNVFRPGEAPLLALDVLRERRRPLSTTELTKAILELRGSPRLSPRQFEMLNRKLNSALNSQFRRGVLRKVGRVGAGGSVVWEIIG